MSAGDDNFDRAMDFGDSFVEDDFARFTNGLEQSTSFADTMSPDDIFSPHDTFSDLTTSARSNLLETPSLLDDESPFLADSYDVSPAYVNADFGNATLGSLFENGYAPAKNNLPALLTPAPAEEDTVNPDAYLHQQLSPSMTRTASTHTLHENEDDRRGLLRQRLSITAGIAKSSRRATKNLNAIVVDDGDEKAVKRAKNTMAARKSRQKKKDEVENLEAQLMAMMDQRDYWKMLAIKYGAPMPASPTLSSAVATPSE